MSTSTWNPERRFPWLGDSVPCPTPQEEAADDRAVSDRTVHAECNGFEVVRYNREGKWYVEPRSDVSREHIGVGEAARRAEACVVLGGVVHFGRPGGQVFDRRVRLLGVAAEDRAATVRLYGEQRVAELEREANK